MVRRREFITGLGSAAAWPFAAQAQQPDHTYRLGFLVPAERQAPAVLALFDELRLNGFIQGKNLTVISGGFDAVDDHLTERAATLVNAAPDVIVAGPELPLRALRAATQSVPIVAMTEDLVAEGLVQRFRNSNHIRRPCRACGSRCERQDRR
jgi:putative tryptophan/tyrosine transport system substrate-binding protein